MPEHTGAAESSRLPPKAARPQPRAPRRYSDPYAVEYSLVVEAGLICPTSSRVTALFNLTRRPQARRTRVVVIGAPHALLQVARRLLVRPQARRRCRL